MKEIKITDIEGIRVGNAQDTEAVICTLSSTQFNYQHFFL